MALVGVLFVEYPSLLGFISGDPEEMDEREQPSHTCPCLLSPFPYNKPSRFESSRPDLGDRH